MSKYAGAYGCFAITQGGA